jgi:serine/threonine-protein kinase RsbW
MPETLIVQADLAELARVNDWLDELADRLALPAATVFAIRLCLEESVTNVARHGFPPEADRPGLEKTVRLSLSRTARDVELSVVDHGVSFDPLAAATPAEPTSIADAEVGGLGIHLMRKFTRHLAYERCDEANRLTLRFDLANDPA